MKHRNRGDLFCFQFAGECQGDNFSHTDFILQLRALTFKDLASTSRSFSLGLGSMLDLVLTAFQASRLRGAAHRIKGSDEQGVHLDTASKLCQVRRCLHFTIEKKMSGGIYAPLESRQIRVMALSPATVLTDPIACTLSTVSLASGPYFAALSYVWGDPAITEPIEVCGQPFQATTNLVAALRQIRHADQPRTIWADAICIDQSNIKEREQQVGIMGQVFSIAHQVIVWLGEDDHPARKAETGMTFVREMSEYFRLGRDLEYPDEKPTMLTEVAFASFCEMLGKPWWNRVWTVQEAILAQQLSFHWGDASCSGEDLFRACDRLRHRADAAQLQTPSNEELGDIVFEPAILFTSRQYRSSLDLWTLVTGFSRRLCSVPHDRIYAFLGLIDQQAAGLPDYTVFIDYQQPSQQIYDMTAFLIMVASGWLDLLTEVAIPRSGILSSAPELNEKPAIQSASWCPRWDMPLDPWNVTLVSGRRGRLEKYNACGGRKASLKRDDYSVGIALLEDNLSAAVGLLDLEGYVVDVIEKVGDVNGGTFQSRNPDIYKQWRNIIKTESRSSEPYQGGQQDWNNTFWYVLSGGNPDFEKGEIDFFDLSVFRSWWRDEIDLEAKKTQRYQGPSNEAALRLCIDEIGIASAFRCLFVSRQGFIGLAPPGTQIGDKVCVLLGGRTPFILREQSPVIVAPKPNKGPMYTLLGDAYVEGMMNGEIISMKGAEKPIAIRLR